MPQDGLNTKSGTVAVMPSESTPNTKRTPNDARTPNSIKEEIKRLTAIEDKLWAILGLKMACDRLRDLNYELGVQQEGTNVTLTIDLKVGFDFDTGLIEGKDVVGVQVALEKQIKELKARL
jgi:hypothetical protein